MPKIRQAVAVLAVAAFCIGFNTFRYPVVCEMVAALSQSTLSAESKPAEKPADSAKAHDAVAEDTATSKHPPGVVCKDGVCTMPLPESPSASLSSTPAGDAASPAPTQTEEKPASPLESPKSADSTEKTTSEDLSKPKGEEPEQKPKTPDSSESKEKDEAAKAEAKTPPAEPAKPDAAAKDDAPKPPENEKGDATNGKTAAKLVSTSGADVALPSDSDKPPAAQIVLIPIQRPHPQAKDAPVAKPALDSKPEAKSEPARKAFRNLPPVDPASSGDTLTLSPELVRAYPVTPAK